MKTNILIFTIALILSPLIVSSQDFQGIAYYKTKTTVDMSQWGGGKLSEQQKKQIAQRMKPFLEKTYILRFDSKSSVYSEEERLDAPGQSMRGGMWASSMSNGPQYKNIANKEFLHEQELFGKQFLISEELKGIEWKMGTESKKIGDYLCFKATAKKVSDDFDWSKLRRRPKPENKEEVSNDSLKATNMEDQAEEIKIIDIEAWYSPQIPVSQGPSSYWGLPGLILELSADRTTMLCTKIIMNPKEKEIIEKPNKGKVVSKAEYNTIMEEKMMEMRSMYRRRPSNRRQ